MWHSYSEGCNSRHEVKLAGGTDINKQFKHGINKENLADFGSVKGVISRNYSKWKEQR